MVINYHQLGFPFTYQIDDALCEGIPVEVLRQNYKEKALKAFYDDQKKQVQFRKWLQQLTEKF